MDEENAIEMDILESSKEELDNIPEEFVGEKPSKFNSILTKLKKNEKLPIFATIVKVFIVILLFALLASNVVLWYNYYESKDLVQPTELEMTMEFQIVLRTGDWADRNRELNNFFSYFQEISGYPFLDDQIMENYRVQNYFHPDNCSTSWNVDFRLRSYYYGPWTGSSTLDAKISSISYDEGLIAPMEPSDDQLEDSFQKLEHDIHTCNDKFSRETRVQDIPYQPTYNKCGDIHALFPYLWSDSSNNKFLNESDPEYWYTGIYSGIFDNGLTFKSDVTLEYTSQEDVGKGVGAVPKSGEYSLRIWSTHLGHGPWDQDAVDEVNDWYYKLVEKFSSDGYPCT